MVHQNEGGLLILDEALEVAHRNGERYYEAELYRLKGEVLPGHAARRGVARSSTGGNVVIEAEPNAVVQAEACFDQSLKTAQKQNAKSGELRAVMSLARLLQKQGREEEALRMLEETYDWFTEGFDTTDLMEARTMLDSHAARTGAQSSKSWPSGSEK